MLRFVTPWILRNKTVTSMDALFNDVKADLIAGLRGHPDRTEECLDLLMIAKYLERIGDHAVNIAEWVVYAITGLYKGEELK